MSKRKRQRAAMSARVAVARQSDQTGSKSEAIAKVGNDAASAIDARVGDPGTPAPADGGGEPDWACDVNEFLVGLHTTRRAELGVDGSGLFNHYSALLDSGSFLRESELNAFKLIQETLPAHAEYAVLRAGLGELAFLLERAGLRAVACEPNAVRFEALKAGVEHLKSSGLEERGRFRTVAGFLPDKARERPLLGVATDFVFNLQLESDEAFRRDLRQLDGLLVSPRLFIRLRETPSEQRAVITFLRSLGFTEITEFPAVQMVYATRPAGGRPPVSDDAAAPGIRSPEEAGFDALVERVMSLVPPATESGTGSTWVERRVREFDMKSAFGNDE